MRGGDSQRLFRSFSFKLKKVRYFREKKRNASNAMSLNDRLDITICEEGDRLERAL